MSILRLNNAAWVPTPHTFGPMEPSLIIVHETGTRITPGAAVKYCIAHPPTNPIRVGYHIIIERDGSVVQLAEFNQKVRHAGISRWKGRSYCNSFSIGIGLVGPTELKGTVKKAKSFYGKWFSEEDGLSVGDSPHHGRGHIWLKHTHAQLAALDRVVMELRQEFPGIDLCGHYQASPGRKIDPAPIVKLTGLGFPPPLPEQKPQDVAESHELVHYNEDDLIHAAEQAAYEMTVEPTSAVLAKSSREYRAMGGLKTSAVSVGIGATALEAASVANITAAKSYLDVVNGFISAYGTPMLIAGTVIAWAVCELVQHYKRESYDAGLYEPSGQGGDAV